MTLEERLTLARAGYSAADIAAFEAPAPDPASDPAPNPAPDPEPASDPAPADDSPLWARALQQSIDNMTSALQASNRALIDMGDPETVEQSAERALAQYLTGTSPDKKSGGKRK